MTYRINEVDGTDPDEANLIRHFNKMVLGWPALSDAHLQSGYWWLIYSDGRPIGFAGLVLFLPGGLVGYAKRCYIEPSARGNGLQIRTLFVREAKAKRLGMKQIVSETTDITSAGNFVKAGFQPFVPEQPWGPEGSMYFVKAL